VKFASGRRGLYRDEGMGERRFAESASYLPVPLSCTICVPTTSLMFKVDRGAHQWPSVWTSP
jgi:hypothetical protein